MGYVKAEYLEALNKNTNNVEKVKFIPPSPEGEDLGGVSKKYIDGIQKAIEELVDKKITKFYASSQGNTHLSDSDKGKIQDMFLYGKSEQVQYKGKNLFDAKGLIGDKSVSNNGITFKYDSANDVFTISGTATKEAINAYLFGGYINTNVIFTLPAGTYTFSTTSQTVVMYAYDGSERKTYIISPSGNTYTLDSDVGITALKPGNQVVGTIVNQNFKIQIEKGSTKTDFEPYVGGIPSPSPDYPQEIKAVVNPKVVVRGKNLLKATGQTQTINGVTFTNNGDGTYTVNGTNTANALTIFKVVSTFTIKENGKYKLTGLPKRHVIKDDIWFGGTRVESAKEDVVLALKKGDILSLDFLVRKGATLNNVLLKPMLSLDTTATYDDYEPYTEQSVTLPYTLYAIPVSTGGNVTIGNQQYVADYVDVERGKIVRKCLRENINFSNANFETETDTQKIVQILNAFSKKILGGKNNGIVISNKFIFASNELLYPFDIYNIVPGISDGTDLRISVPKDFILDDIRKISAFVFGILVTPEEIDLTPDQIQAYKSLSTNYPVTNIEVSSEQLNGYTVFNYPISMAEGWNYVKQQIGDTRDYIYDMDLQSAEAYVNSEYAVALTELEV